MIWRDTPQVGKAEPSATGVVSKFHTALFKLNGLVCEFAPIVGNRNTLRLLRERLSMLRKSISRDLRSMSEKIFVLSCATASRVRLLSLVAVSRKYQHKIRTLSALKSQPLSVRFLALRKSLKLVCKRPAPLALLKQAQQKLALVPQLLSEPYQSPLTMEVGELKHGAKMNGVFN